MTDLFHVGIVDHIVYKLQRIKNNEVLALIHILHSLYAFTGFLMLLLQRLNDPHICKTFVFFSYLEPWLGCRVSILGLNVFNSHFQRLVSVNASFGRCCTLVHKFHIALSCVGIFDWQDLPNLRLAFLLLTLNQIREIAVTKRFVYFPHRICAVKSLSKHSDSRLSKMSDFAICGENKLRDFLFRAFKNGLRQSSSGLDVTGTLWH